MYTLYPGPKPVIGRNWTWDSVAAFAFCKQCMHAWGLGQLCCARKFARLFQVQNAVEHPLSYHLSPIFQIFKLDAIWAGCFPTLQIIIMAASTSPPQTERGSMENWDVIITSAAFNIRDFHHFLIFLVQQIALFRMTAGVLEGWWQGFLYKEIDSHHHSPKSAELLSCMQWKQDVRFLSRMVAAHCDARKGQESCETTPVIPCRARAKRHRLQKHGLYKNDDIHNHCFHLDYNILAHAGTRRQSCLLVTVVVIQPLMARTE